MADASTANNMVATPITTDAPPIAVAAPDTDAPATGAPTPVTAGCALTVCICTASSTYTLSFIHGASQAPLWLEEATLHASASHTRDATLPDGSCARVRVESVTAGSGPLGDSQLRLSESLRGDGNALVRSGSKDFQTYKRAMLVYNRSLDALRRVAEGEKRSSVAERMESLRCNLALCALRAGEWTNARMQSEGGGKGAKATYRAGKAALELGMGVRGVRELRETGREAGNGTVEAEKERGEEEVKRGMAKGRAEFAETYSVWAKSCVFERPWVE